MLKGQKFVIGIYAAILISTLSGIVIKTEYAKRVPQYKTGDCIRIVTNQPNEFIKPEYDYMVIDQVGTRHYKLTKFYTGETRYSKVWVASFADVRRYASEFEVIECNDMLKKLKSLGL